MTADQKVLSERCASRDYQRYAVVVQDLELNGFKKYPCKTQNFSGDGEEFTKVPRRKSHKLFTLTIH